MATTKWTNEKMPPKARVPSATVVVVDVGKVRGLLLQFFSFPFLSKGMDGGPQGGPTYLEQALEGVGHLLQQKVMYPVANKPEYFSVVLFGTRETKNPLSDSGYSRIYVLQDMAPVAASMLKTVATVSPGEQDGECKLVVHRRSLC